MHFRQHDVFAALCGVMGRPIGYPRTVVNGKQPADDPETARCREAIRVRMEKAKAAARELRQTKAALAR